MKVIIFALCAIFIGTTAMVVNTTDVHLSRKLGAEHCTWGPSYWCQNLTIAAGCEMTRHCAQKVWPHEIVTEDHDSVCEICKDMVQQARDQLESNQTQEDLKAVFEGSCKLMLIKPIVQECDTLVDQFIPDLVETLASQMNPSVVCSVSGLCNSARIDQLILEHEATLKKTHGKVVISLKDDELKPNECSKCFTIATRMEGKFKETSRDHLLDEFLTLCRNVGTQSDACANIVLQYFTTIYNHLKENFNAKKICLLSGQCSSLFHNHEDMADKGPEVEIRPLSSVGMVDVDDDLPCKLCEQLVGHLRDVLIANTTQIEFKRVLNGLCGQTESFADQCNSIVNEYYPEIYDYLVHRLNGNAVCTLGGICPSPGKDQSEEPIAPLLPIPTAELATGYINDRKKFKKHNFGENGAGIRKTDMISEPEKMQLPIQRFSNPSSSLLNAPRMDAEGQTLCVLCEYLLHEVQKIISDPKSEDKVKMSIKKICKRLPDSVEGICDEFIDTYGDAIVALLAQEVDPSVVCPTMNICPSQELLKVFEDLPKDWMVETEVEVEDKPSCPLCLLGVQQIYNVIKSNNTEANIVNELDKLCNHLPKEMNGQCVDFVNAYSKELIRLLLSDLTPQEICVYIKLCDPTRNVAPLIFYPMNSDGEIISNEIPIYEMEKVPKKHLKDDLECVLCQYLVGYVEGAMNDTTTREELKTFVHRACDYLPKHMGNQCTAYVNMYADKIIELLSSDVHPKLICALLEACPTDSTFIKESITECAVCQAVMSEIDTILTNPTVDSKIENIVKNICTYMPITKHEKCINIIEVYGQSIINLLKMNISTQKICGKIALCSNSDLFVLSNEHFRDRRANVDGTKPCTWGDKYVCSSPEIAAKCYAEEHCKTKVWSREDSPPSSQGAAAIAAANHR